MIWNFYFDREAENYFISDSRDKTVAMVHQPDLGPLLASAPDLADEVARLQSLLIRAQRLVPDCHSRWHEDAQRVNAKERDQ